MLLWASPESASPLASPVAFWLRQSNSAFWRSHAWAQPRLPSASRCEADVWLRQSGVKDLFKKPKLKKEVNNSKTKNVKSSTKKIYSCKVTDFKKEIGQKNLHQKDKIYLFFLLPSPGLCPVHWLRLLLSQQSFRPDRPVAYAQMPVHCKNIRLITSIAN